MKKEVKTLSDGSVQFTRFKSGYDRIVVERMTADPRPYVWKSECERRSCAICSKPNMPVFEHNHSRRRHEFVPQDTGCWAIIIGKKPQRICEDGCDCRCHREEEE